MPHAAALARELREEVQRLDAFQEQLVLQLVEELSDMSFLSFPDHYELPAQKNFEIPPAISFVSSGRDDEAAPAETRHDVLTGARSDTTKLNTGPSPSLAFKPHTMHSHRIAAAVYPDRPAASPHVDEAPLPLPQHRHTQMHLSRRGSCARKGGVGKATQRTPSPLPRKTRQETETLRARRALLCIREDRDAYVNAKARRAQELLREGREAVRRSRERRMAESLSAHATHRSKRIE